MELASRLEISAEHDAHINTPERVARREHGLGADPERLGDRSTSVRFAATNEHPSSPDGRVGVVDVDDVDPLLSQHARSHTPQALPPGAVQHFDDDPALRRRQRVRMAGDMLAPRLEQRNDTGTDHQQSQNQRDAAAAVTRLFQNRNVGSRIGHRVWTV